jgi:hypothetical protein
VADQEQIVKVALAGAGAFAAYKFLYEPWATKRALQELTEAQMRANLQQGMGIKQAAEQAIAGACMVGATTYKIPPAASGAICQGVGILATKGVQLAAQGAVIAGRVIGHGAAVVGKDIGHGAAVIGRGIGKGGQAVGSATKFVAYTAPKKVITTGAKVVKFAAYTAPKKVITTGVKTVAKGTKAVVKSISHGFGLWGLEDARQGQRPRRSTAGNPFATYANGRAAAGNAPGRKRRSLAGLPDAGPARRRAGPGAAAARFYTRHL